MRALRSVRIAGTGSFVPATVVSNQSLIEKYKLDTTDDWVKNKIGIKNRRYANPEMQNSDLAVEASRQALDAAGLRADDVDALIMGPGFGDVRYPATAPILAKKLGLRDIFAFDVMTACSGFLSGLQLGRRYVQDGTINTCLVVGSDIGSRGVKFDPHDRLMGVIFGDAAGAAVLTAGKEGEGFLSDYARIEPDAFDIGGVHLSGSLAPVTEERVRNREQFAAMDGRRIWDLATTRMPEAIRAVCSEANVRVEEVDFVVTHQANLRLIEAVFTDLDVPFSKTYTTIEEYGNSGGASLPVTLDEAVRKGKVRPGMLVCLATCGGNFFYNASLLRWS